MAGIGSRLRPFTYSKPKAFLKVAGKRVIDHILDSFEEASEKSLDLLIITGYQNRTIKDYLKQKYENDFNITFKIQEPKGYVGDIPFFGGLGQAIYLSRDWYTEQIKSYESTAPEDYAFIFLSDMIPIDGFAGVFNALCGKDEDNPQKENLADEFKDDDERFKNHQINSQNIKKTPSDIKDVDGIIGVMHVSKEDASNYGIIETDKKTGYIKKLVEKPENFISNQAIAGVYAFKPKAMKRLYEHLEKDVKNFENKKGEVQITPSIQGLVDDGFKLISRPFIKGILDFGRPNRLLEGNKYLLKEQDNVIGGPIEKISNSSLTAPSFIGENVEIINCVIGPFCSIGDDCILRDCVIRDSVIGDGCVLERIITENSIIGDYVKLDDLIKNNLIIGDRSNIRSSK